MPGRILRAATALATLLPLLALTSPDLPPQNLPVLGGTGGTAFTRDCGAGRVLSGVRYRSGMVIDAIGLLCRPVLSDGKLGPETTIGTIAGGSGGTTHVAGCPSGTVLTGMFVKYGSYVSYIIGSCSTWRASTRTFATPPSANTEDIGLALTAGATGVENCESQLQPGAALRGRAASFIDALGLVCDEP